MTNSLNEKTKVPLGILIPFALVLVSVVAWAATLEARVGSHEKVDDSRVATLQERSERTYEFMHSIDKRLERIEDRLRITNK